MTLVPPSTSYSLMEWGEGGCNITLLVTRWGTVLSSNVCSVGKGLRECCILWRFCVTNAGHDKKGRHVLLSCYKTKDAYSHVHVTYMWPTCDLHVTKTSDQHVPYYFRFTGNIRNGFRFSSGLLDFVTSQVAFLLAHMQHSFTWWVTTCVASE